MAIFAHYRPPNFRLERNGVVLSAVVAYYFVTGRSIRPKSGLLRPALWTPLRLHHVPLIEHFLFLFREEKDVPTLNT